MATITSLSLNNIRSHSKYAAKFSKEVTLITGANGSGKTSILEALYLSLRGVSFKGSDLDLLRKDESWWRIEMKLDDGQKRVVSFNSEKETGRKQFIIDGKTTNRLPLKFKHPVVLFEPDDLRLLNGSPARRRQFIDSFISQLNPLYSSALRKYDRALKQRNHLLKHSAVNKDQLFVWNITLVDQGAYIIEQRIAFIERINNKLSGMYQVISDTKDEVSAHYSHTYVGDIKQKLLNDLQAHYEKDHYLGSTSVGPHRHDVIFELNNSPAQTIASRGEVRTIVLALKFLEVDIIEELTGIMPIILLDDVFSELDANRQTLLTRYLEGRQIIITSATSHAEELNTIKLLV